MGERKSIPAIGTFGFAALLAAGVASSASAQTPAAPAAGPVKLGIVTFLTGPAAGPFGVPARNGAEIVIESLNAGTVPAPYNTVGLAGSKIEPRIIDEAGSAANVVTEYRNLVQRDQVDAVVGYISSGNCLAVTPVAEELKALTVLFDCGTPRIFEEKPRKYVFRPTPHATMDSVGAARYLVAKKKDISLYSGINQNYAWGQDSWRDFVGAMSTLAPKAKVDKELFPKLFAGEFGAEISTLLTSKSQALHTSFWNGDLESFIYQEQTRGLDKRMPIIATAGEFGAEISTLLTSKSQALHTSFWNGDLESFIYQEQTRGLDKRMPIIATAGESAIWRLGNKMPDGTIIGARGPHGPMARDSELNKWFVKVYTDRYGSPPTYPSYHMAQSILGLKAAWDKAAQAKNGSRPAIDDVVAAFENLEFEGPSTKIKMAIGNGHQGISEIAYGTYKFNKQKNAPEIVDLMRFPAECVNPPADGTAEDWLKGGMKGAKC
jgi:branched-chain amino acid transport system substrate-binding protein